MSQSHAVKAGRTTLHATHAYVVEVVEQATGLRGVGKAGLADGAHIGGLPLRLRHGVEVEHKLQQLSKERKRSERENTLDHTSTHA